jgi:hypothetical protein
MKDAYYFPHDSNASHDQKILQLRVSHGWEGYGLFWALIESLRDSPTYELPLDSMAGLSLGYGLANGTLDGLLKACYKLGLLHHNDTHFWSASLKRRMEIMEATRKSLSVAGKAGAKVRWQGHKPRNATPMAIKESKVKESIKAFIKPTIEEITAYCKERGNGVNPVKLFNHYEAGNWMRGKTKISNWKACVRTWESDGSESKKELEVVL